MRKIILGLAITLDGYIEGPKGEYDWCFTDQDYGMKDFLQRIDAIFYGRKSYELTMNTEEAGVEGAGMDMFGKMEHYVFSRTLRSLPGNVHLVRNLEEVENIKKGPGRDIWLWGGALLTADMLHAKLVDELWLAVHPILLGGGKKLFPESGERIMLDLIESKAYGTGLVSLRYHILK